MIKTRSGFHLFVSNVPVPTGIRLLGPEQAPGDHCRERGESEETGDTVVLPVTLSSTISHRLSVRSPGQFPSPVRREVRRFYLHRPPSVFIGHYSTQYTENRLRPSVVVHPGGSSMSVQVWTRVRVSSDRRDDRWAPVHLDLLYVPRVAQSRRDGDGQ